MGDGSVTFTNPLILKLIDNISINHIIKSFLSIILKKFDNKSNLIRLLIASSLFSPEVLIGHDLVNHGIPPNALTNHER